MRFKNYFQVEKYLNSFINYEKKINFPYRHSLKLERVKLLMKNLKIPYSQFKAVHIAGTKGKGSVAAFSSYILASSGYRVGVFTSPHFFDFRERIKILEKKGKVREKMISKKELRNFLEKFYFQLESLRETTRGKLTFFEVCTAIAFQYFYEKEVDFAVLETGLGGRLDATNIVHPSLSILTHIGYDHTDKLGKTLKEIAYEKAGIIKENTPVISAPQRRCVRGVIRKKAKEEKAKLYILGEDFYFKNVRVKKDSTLFDFSFKEFSADNLRISMKGLHQVENASLALAGVYILKEKGEIKALSLKKALREAHIEGRFEILKENPLIIADVAHNLSSFFVLKETLSLYFPHRKIIFIFSASQDKPVEKMLRVIRFEKIILTSFDNPRSFPPEVIQKKANLKETEIVPSPYEALKLALNWYKRNRLILISGSFYLVAQLKKYLRNGVI